MEGCLACDLAAGRLPLPGGRIAETQCWLVDHTIGPLSIGTVIVRPKRHVLHVWQLDEVETAEMGPFFRRVASALAAVVEPEQIYVTLWSHAGGVPGHIHWVFQPVTAALMCEFDGLYGPHLQVAMFDHSQPPPTAEVEAVVARLRSWLGANNGQ